MIFQRELYDISCQIDFHSGLSAVDGASSSEEIPIVDWQSSIIIIITRLKPAFTHLSSDKSYQVIKVIFVKICIVIKVI